MVGAPTRLPGDVRPDSDVDIMIISEIYVFELEKPIKTIRKLLGREVDLNLHTPAEWRRLKTNRVVSILLKGEKISSRRSRPPSCWLRSL
ncbi:nucleotidyltransferase domain-containing protein [Rhizobium ruizarguesonis]